MCFRAFRRSLVFLCFFVYLFSLLITTPTLAIELANFADLKAYYPGDVNHGGSFTDADIVQMVGRDAHQLFKSSHRIETSALRLSWTLNKIGSPHRLGRRPISIKRAKDQGKLHNLLQPELNRQQQAVDSIQGIDNQQYIFNGLAFGPFLAKRYGNPIQIWKQSKQQEKPQFSRLFGQQGIIRVVTYHRKHHQAVGRIGLWNCDHWHQASEWTLASHIIAVELWPTPDSNCPADVVTKNHDESKLSADLPVTLHKLFLAANSQAKQQPHKTASQLETDLDEEIDQLERDITSKLHQLGLEMTKHSSQLHR